MAELRGKPAHFYEVSYMIPCIASEHHVCVDCTTCGLQKLCSYHPAMFFLPRPDLGVVVPGKELVFEIIMSDLPLVSSPGVGLCAGSLSISGLRY